MFVMQFGHAGPVTAAADAKRPRHAEMHQQHVARAEIGQKIFGAAAEPRNGLPGKPLGRNLAAAAGAKSGRRASTRRMRTPSITGASPRRTVSTSGSSGTLFTFRRRFDSASSAAVLAWLRAWIRLAMPSDEP